MSTAKITPEALTKIRGAFIESLTSSLAESRTAEGAVEGGRVHEYHTSIIELASQHLDKTFPLSKGNAATDLPPPATIAAVNQRLERFADEVWGSVKGHFGKRGSGEAESTAIFGAKKAAVLEADKQAHLSATPSQKRHLDATKAKRNNWERG